MPSNHDMEPTISLYAPCLILLIYQSSLGRMMVFGSLSCGNWTGFASATLIGVGRSAQAAVQQINEFFKALSGKS